jgi:hypothetical protein
MFGLIKKDLAYGLLHFPCPYGSFIYLDYSTSSI